MATIINQLQKEIAARRAELEKLEAALEALQGGGTSSKRGAGTRKPRTPEQRAAQAERMKKIWAAKKKAGKKSAVKKAARKAPAKKGAAGGTENAGG